MIESQYEIVHGKCHMCDKSGDVIILKGMSEKDMCGVCYGKNNQKYIQ